MNAEYDTEMEMEVLYAQIEDAVEFAANAKSTLLVSTNRTHCVQYSVPNRIN